MTQSAQGAKLTYDSELLLLAGYRKAVGAAKHPALSGPEMQEKVI